MINNIHLLITNYKTASIKKQNIPTIVYISKSLNTVVSNVKKFMHAIDRNLKDNLKNSKSKGNMISSS